MFSHPKSHAKISSSSLSHLPPTWMQKRLMDKTNDYRDSGYLVRWLIDVFGMISVTVQKR